jgi:hypothetical protein
MLTLPPSLLTSISPAVFNHAPTATVHFTTSYGQLVTSVAQIVENTVGGTQVTIPSGCTVHLPVWMSFLVDHVAVLDGKKQTMAQGLLRQNSEMDNDLTL